MIASIVVPLDWRSKPSTVSCLENRADANVAALFGRGALAGFPVVGADRLAGDLGGLDFARALRMAIRFSLVSTTASCAATDTSPAREGRARGRYEPRSGLPWFDYLLNLGNSDAPVAAKVERIRSNLVALIGRL